MPALTCRFLDDFDGFILANDLFNYFVWHVDIFGGFHDGLNKNLFIASELNCFKKVVYKIRYYLRIVTQWSSLYFSSATSHRSLQRASPASFLLSPDVLNATTE